MERKHTDGPWKVLFDEGNDMHVVTMGSALGGGNPCEVQHRIEYNHGLYPDAGTKRHGQFVEADANARLIAAAPDLLAACEAAVEAIEKNISDEPYAPAWAARLHTQLKVAIAKAIGGAQ